MTWRSFMRNSAARFVCSFFSLRERYWPYTIHMADGLVDTPAVPRVFGRGLGSDSELDPKVALGDIAAAMSGMNLADGDFDGEDGCMLANAPHLHSLQARI